MSSRNVVPAGRFITARHEVPGWGWGRWHRVLKGRLMPGVPAGIADKTTPTRMPGNPMNRPFGTERYACSSVPALRAGLI